MRLGLTGIVALASLSGCASITRAVHSSIEYQRSLVVVHTDTVPGHGAYDVFVDTRNGACAVDFTPALSPTRSLYDFHSFSLTEQHPNLLYEQELLDKYCPQS